MMSKRRAQTDRAIVLTKSDLVATAASAKLDSLGWSISITVLMHLDMETSLMNGTEISRGHLQKGMGLAGLVAATEAKIPEAHAQIEGARELL